MNEGHYIFGDVVCEHFNIPNKYRNWAAIPDMKYFSNNHYTWLLLHRWSLHGMPNIPICIEQGKQTAPYEKEYEDIIELLVTSHTYLDVFNGPIVPSYPKSWEFKYIDDLKWKYIKDPLDDPDGLKEVFKDIMLSNPSDLKHQLVKEYEKLPKHGDITEAILELYE